LGSPLFRKHESEKQDVLLLGLFLQKNLKYGELVTEDNKSRHMDTILFL
jgi:hypothetical protein